MPKTSRHPRIGSVYRDQVHRKTTPGDLTGLMTQPQPTKVGGYYVWLIPLAVGLIGIAGVAKFRFMIAAWSVIASSALGTVLFAIALTVGVCGSIAGAVIWWTCQQELRTSRNHRAEIREYLAAHGTQGTDADQRQAA